MSTFIQQIEAALLPIAIRYAPEGTEPKALAHQWMHALAYGFAPFAVKRGATAKKLISILKKTQLYTDAATFKSKLPGTPIKPSKESPFTFIDLFAGVGGMRIGFQKAGGTCVFSSEFEKNAQATYAENHGDYPFGDMNQRGQARINSGERRIVGL